MKWVTFRVHGKVQGVYFRRDTKLLADKLGLYGHVKNESDGTVTGHVGGDDNLVDQFINIVKNGVNERSVVTKCEIDDSTPDSNITTFEILK